ncbi:bacteriophage CI repressor [Thioploca ingrica]|uniref:Bacteriophage CI repressor n=1 Tax=Thioploca ingrica TaxID=40754 RepID=A0A090AGP5_9GAMM|nr:bacteriophage CI repressor [Thioploca ingrica]
MQVKITRMTTMVIHQRITRVRKHKGMSQKEFSAMIGVSQSYLSEVENGKSKPSLELLSGIVNRFSDINADWLLTGRGAMQNPPPEGEPSDDARIAELIEQLTPPQRQVVLALTNELLKSNH